MNAFKEGCQRKASEKTIFTIPKPPVLRRTSIRMGSHADCMGQFVRNCRKIAYNSKKSFYWQTEDELCLLCHKEVKIKPSTCGIRALADTAGTADTEISLDFAPFTPKKAPNISDITGPDNRILKYFLRRVPQLNILCAQLRVQTDMLVT